MSAKPKAIFMETTSIEAEQTAHEIMSYLVRAGARQIQLTYTPEGKVSGMNFLIVAAGQSFPFQLPARVDAVKKIFLDRRIKTQGSFGAVRFREFDTQQAERVAWRQLLRWIQAQLAMIDAHMVQPEEVFAPYLLDRDGRTLYEHLAATRFKALPEAKEAV